MMEKPQLSQKLRLHAYAAFNMTHGFWDGLVFVPDGELLPEGSEIVRASRSMERFWYTANGGDIDSRYS